MVGQLSDLLNLLNLLNLLPCLKASVFVFKVEGCGRALHRRRLARVGVLEGHQREEEGPHGAQELHQGFEAHFCTKL